MLWPGEIRPVPRPAAASATYRGDYAKERRPRQRRRADRPATARRFAVAGARGRLPESYENRPQHRSRKRRSKRHRRLGRQKTARATRIARAQQWVLPRLPVLQGPDEGWIGRSARTRYDARD